MGICSSKVKEPLKLEPAPRDPIDRVAWKLHRAIHVDDVEQVVKQMVIKVPSLATPRGTQLSPAGRAKGEALALAEAVLRERRAADA